MSTMYIDDEDVTSIWIDHKSIAKETPQLHAVFIRALYNLRRTALDAEEKKVFEKFEKIRRPLTQAEKQQWKAEDEAIKAAYEVKVLELVEAFFEGRSAISERHFHEWTPQELVVS